MPWFAPGLFSDFSDKKFSAVLVLLRSSTAPVWVSIVLPSVLLTVRFGEFATNRPGPLLLKILATPRFRSPVEFRIERPGPFTSSGTAPTESMPAETGSIAGVRGLESNVTVLNDAPPVAAFVTELAANPLTHVVPAPALPSTTIPAPEVEETASVLSRTTALPVDPALVETLTASCWTLIVLIAGAAPGRAEIPSSRFPAPVTLASMPRMLPTVFVILRPDAATIPPMLVVLISSAVLPGF